MPTEMKRARRMRRSLLQSNCLVEYGCSETVEKRTQRKSGTETDRFRFSESVRRVAGLQGTTPPECDPEARSAVLVGQSAIKNCSGGFLWEMLAANSEQASYLLGCTKGGNEELSKTNNFSLSR